VLHLGEGTDEDAAEEIFVLDRIGALNDRTVLVHGVGLSEAGHALRRKRGAALVWCPTSNRFMLGSTLNARAQGGFEPVALGSDSALTARGNLLDEIRAAHENEQATAESIYRMVTESAAAILRLRDGEGFIRAGSIADLIAVPWNRKTPSEALAGMDMAQVEMALLAGGLQLGSIEMVKRWPAPQSSGLEAISVDGVTRLVRAPIRPLMAETGRCLTGGVWLAGRRVEL
jgi:cytosine/adenosine deaminase-related metal-dependent hydrolase